LEVALAPETIGQTWINFMVTYTIIFMLMHEAYEAFSNENCLGILLGKGAESIKMSP
jgi:hypothetical protein